MSDPMSERELGEIRVLSAEIEDCRARGVHDSETNKEAAAKLPALLAEIDRQRELMREAADEIEIRQNTKCDCGSWRPPSPSAQPHKPDCLIARLRTAGEG